MQINIAFILRAVIVALSLVGVAWVSVALALALVPTFYAFSSLAVFVATGLVAIADI